MPRLVDHAERRRTIVHAASRLIGARGIDATNMRVLAREAGYTNGALSHYFTGKDEILRAAFEYVFEATNERVARSMGRRMGLSAIRRMAREIMPQTEETLLEARVAVSLWQRALSDPQLAETNNRQLAVWREETVVLLRQAQEAGEIVDGVNIELVANLLVTAMVGMQVTAVLDAAPSAATEQDAMIDHILAGISAPGAVKHQRSETG